MPYVKLGDTYPLGFAANRFLNGVATDLTVKSTALYLNSATTPMAYAPSPVDVGTGLYTVPVVASTDNGFAVGNVCFVFGLGTDADGVAAAVFLGGFMVTARGPDDLAYPATSGRSLLVAGAGGVAIDWANVQNPSTTVGLSGTTVKDATDVNADTDTLLSRLTSQRATNLDYLDAAISSISLSGAGDFEVDSAAPVGARMLSEKINLICDELIGEGDGFPFSMSIQRTTKNLAGTKTRTAWTISNGRRTRTSTDGTP